MSAAARASTRTSAFSSFVAVDITLHDGLAVMKRSLLHIHVQRSLNL